MLQSVPSATYTELAQSTVPPVQLSDFHGLITPTLLGPSDKPYLVTTVDAYNATFGANGAGSPFYAQIKRALARGTALYIQRLTATGAVAASRTAGTNVTFAAKYVGAYGNQVSTKYTNLATGITSVTLVVSYNGTTETFTAGTYLLLAPIVTAKSSLINMTIGATPAEPANDSAAVFLTSGADGSFSSDTTRAAAVNTLLQNFNPLNTLSTVGALGAYTPADAANLLAYAAGRADLVALFELDPSLTPSQAATAAGALTIPAGSSFLAAYWGSFINAYSPDDQAVIKQSVLTDVMSVISFSDTVSGNSYMAPAGGNRGQLANIQSFDYNMLSPGQSVQANALVQLGINIVGQHKAFGPVVWGAATMNQKNAPLDALNVRRMMLWLREQLQPIFEGELFEPQDPSTWKLAYNKVKPILVGLAKNKAITAWQYVGDQNASTVNDVQYNKLIDVQNGIYKVLINIVPTGYITSIAFTAEINSASSQFQAS